jgi:L-seryl-tRNA(Ser) seleniumtransferase
VSARSAPDPAAQRRLRALPAVDRLATAVARAELADRRGRLLEPDGAGRSPGGAAPAGGNGGDGDDEQLDLLVAAARRRLAPGTPRVLNATGTVLHTNLGRAPLADAARRAVAAAAEGYCGLELDLVTGQRASRGRRAETLIAELTGGADALVVNNGAAAVLLAVAALAGPGGRVAISRGELVEIGGGARVADIVAASGAIVAEVGATNRTTAEDYAAAIAQGAQAILRVHQSNFTMRGYVHRPSLRELSQLGVPVIDDIGSGALSAELAELRGEPAARESLRDGATLVVFSGDKLLGGPQAGLIAGTRDAVSACRALPLARALRLDKLRLAALEATLELHLDPGVAVERIPVLEMLTQTEADVAERARRLAGLTGGRLSTLETEVGGGSLPARRRSDPVVSIDPGPAGAEALAAALRTGDPPLLARIRDGRILIAVRTLGAQELALAAECLAGARDRLAPAPGR